MVVGQVGPRSRRHEWGEAVSSQPSVGLGGGQVSPALKLLVANASCLARPVDGAAGSGKLPPLSCWQRWNPGLWGARPLSSKISPGSVLTPRACGVPRSGGTCLSIVGAGGRGAPGPARERLPVASTAENGLIQAGLSSCWRGGALAWRLRLVGAWGCLAELRRPRLVSARRRREGDASARPRSWLPPFDSSH